MPAHLEDEYRSGQRQADPEPPFHVDEFGIGPRLRRRRLRLERHAADRAGPGTQPGGSAGASGRCTSTPGAASAGFAGCGARYFAGLATNLSRQLPSRRSKSRRRGRLCASPSPDRPTSRRRGLSPPSRRPEPQVLRGGDDGRAALARRRDSAPGRRRIWSGSHRSRNNRSSRRARSDVLRSPDRPTSRRPGPSPGSFRSYPGSSNAPRVSDRTNCINLPIMGRSKRKLSQDKAEGRR